MAGAKHPSGVGRLLKARDVCHRAERASNDVRGAVVVGRVPTGATMVVGGQMLSWEPGSRYQTRDGISGEVRTLREGERVRLTRQTAETDRPTRLQVTLSCPRNVAARITLRFHHEKLSSAEERERMQAYWKAVAGRLAHMIEAR